MSKKREIEKNQYERKQQIDELTMIVQAQHQK